jgi:hypothetical protein
VLNEKRRDLQYWRALVRRHVDELRVGKMQDRRTAGQRLRCRGGVRAIRSRTASKSQVATLRRKGRIIVEELLHHPPLAEIECVGEPIGALRPAQLRRLDGNSSFGQLSKEFSRAMTCRKSACLGLRYVGYDGVQPPGRFAIAGSECLFQPLRGRT